MTDLSTRYGLFSPVTEKREREREIMAHAATDCYSTHVHLAGGWGVGLVIALDAFLGFG